MAVRFGGITTSQSKATPLLTPINSKQGALSTRQTETINNNNKIHQEPRAKSEALVDQAALVQSAAGASLIHSDAAGRGTA